MPTDKTTHPAPVDAVSESLDSWQRELGTVGGPNSLLWYDDAQVSLELTQAHPGGLAMLLSDRLTTLSDMYRERTAFVDARARARILRDKAAELHDEHGLTGLFLGAGLASMPLGSRTLSAPVLLRTLDLIPVDGSERDLELVVGDVIEVNPALVDLLARFGVTLDEDAVEAAARTRSGFDPTLASREVERQAAGLRGLTVSPRLVASTFTYSKASLAADLTDNAREWATRPLVRLAAGEEGTHADLPPAQPDPDLEDENLVLPLDLEQARVVAAARAGISLAVDAPATTGGTQTVAATLAAAVADGATTLLVSPSRPAVEDIVARLATVGLDDLVLHADDDPRTRVRVLETLLAVVDAEPARVAPPNHRGVAHLRDRLAGHREALHTVRDPWGVSASEAQIAVARITRTDTPPTSRVRLAADTLAVTDLEATRTMAARLAEVAARGAWRGGSEADPWFGARLTSTEEARTAALVVRRLLGPDGLDRADRLVRTMCAESHLTPSSTIDGWRADVDAVSAVRDTTEIFGLDVYEAPLTEMLAATSTAYREQHGPELGVVRRNSRRRQARALVRPGHTPADLHQELAAAHAQNTLWRERSGLGARPAPSASLDAARAAVDEVRADLRWLAPRLAGTQVAADLGDLPVGQLRAHLRRLADHLERARVVPVVTPVLDAARAAGFADLVADFARRDLPAARVRTETEFVWWSSMLDALRGDDPRYGRHDGASLRRARTQLAEMDAQLMRDRAAHIRARAFARVRAAATTSQVDALRRALASPPPLADLWRVAGDLLSAWPVWACSPVALPVVVPADRRVDLTVLDAAHLMTPAVAAGAIARARTVLAVGDVDGPAPAPYRAGAGLAASDDDIDIVRDGSSVLVALADRLPAVRLRVAYGRTDARLAARIDGLVHLPSPGGPNPMVLERVTTDGNAEHTLEAEVARVLRLVRAHLRTPRGRSMAVVTFTQEHADRITEALRGVLGDDATKILAEQSEPLVVVPAHRLAGRMRDIVIVAPGLTPGGEGRPGHRFGVLRLGGGEHLVGAAAGAARSWLVVVTSLTTADLGAPRDADDGVSRLRRLLADVERPRSAVPTAEPENPLVAQLAARLRTAGLEVLPGFGEPGHAVDLVVRRPGGDGPSVAVITDDPAGPVLDTRERDRLWPHLLADRGFVPLYVSTIDLFAAPEPEATRIVAAAEGRA